jgi:hypothetical protein
MGFSLDAAVAREGGEYLAVAHTADVGDEPREVDVMLRA